MSGRYVLTVFAAEHQAREVELRRLQNCYAAESAIAFVGVVDTSWSDLADDGAPDELKVPHFGVLPVSREVQSNWHIGNDQPNNLDPATNPDVWSDGGEIRYVWLTFKVTSNSGFLYTHPDGDRLFVEWGKEGVSECGNFMFCGFETEQDAQFWTSSQAEALTQ